MIRFTRPISWYYPKIVLNRAGVSLQWWWGWRGETPGSIPVHWVVLWFRWPPRVARR